MMEDLYDMGVGHKEFWVPRLYMKQLINRKLHNMGF